MGDESVMRRGRLPSLLQQCMTEVCSVIFLRARAPWNFRVVNGQSDGYTKVKEKWENDKKQFIFLYKIE